MPLIDRWENWINPGFVIYYQYTKEQALGRGITYVLQWRIIGS
jgi:hypothetical protein